MKATYDKEYHKKYLKKWRKKRRDWLDNLKKEFKCENCSEDRFYCLIFHHRNPKEKVESVSTMLSRNYSKKEILEEIKKCQILCANCHRELHYNLNNSM